MSARIIDRDRLAALDPGVVAAYLLAQGWQRVAAEQNATWWRREQPDGPYEILLPLDRTLRDYPLRMWQALDTLSEAEERSQRDVYNALTIATVDLVSLRAHLHGENTDSVPVETGIALVEQSKNLAFAAACSTAEPRAAYTPGRRPDEAIRYLRGLRLGQTERGSYTVTLLSPAPQPRQARLPGLEDQGEAFERRVVRTLVGALGWTRRAVDQATTTGGELTLFHEGIEQGVSADLCDALNRIGETSRLTLEVGVRWSATRPGPEAAPIRFEPQDLRLLGSAAATLRETLVLRRVRLVGPITGLDRPPTDLTGTIVVETDVQGTRRKVRVPLEENAYERAMVAHGDRKLISLVVDLDLGRRPATAERVYEFRVLDGS